QDSDGAIRPLVDGWLVRNQGARHVNGHGAAAGLLVFLAGSAVRGVCPRAQMAHAFPCGRRLVRFPRRPHRQRLPRSRIMTQVLDVNERVSQLRGSQTLGAPARASTSTPATATLTANKLATFAITF